MQVVVHYNPKKKCLEVKGNKKYNRDVRLAGLHVLKRTHALEMGDAHVLKRAIKGVVDLDDIRSLEEKKSPRPKWKHQVAIKKGKSKFVNVKNGEEVDQYSPRVFIEDSKIFVL